MGPEGGNVTYILDQITTCPILQATCQNDQLMGAPCTLELVGQTDPSILVTATEDRIGIIRRSLWHYSTLIVLLMDLLLNSYGVAHVHRASLRDHAQV